MKFYLQFLILLFAFSNLFSQPTTKIYYSQYRETQSNIYQADMDGSNEVMITMPLRPKALAVDWKSSPQKLYVGLIPISGEGKIIRCDIDGSNQQDVLTNLIGIAEIELDLTNRKIYWVQDTYDDDRIFKANMDGLNSEIQQIYYSTSPSRELWGIALDVMHNRMWFSDRGGTCYSSYIRTMSTSGTNLTNIINPVCNPHDIEYFDGKIYWGDLDGLNFANTDGSAVTNLVSGANVEGLAIDGHYLRIYWIDYTNNNVKRVDIDGSNELSVPTGHNTLSKIDTDYNPSATTDVEDFHPLPLDYQLHQNYPNPFNPSTTISWHSPEGSWQTIKVFDVLGNEVTTLVNEELPAGEYELGFNSNHLSRKGGTLTSGIYFYQLKACSFIQTKKMILIR